MNNTLFPLMIIEQRSPETPHRVPAPDLSPENMSQQVQDAIQLNEDAKAYEFREQLMQEVRRQMAPFAWRQTTIDILIKYIEPFAKGVTGEEIKKATFDVLGFDGFDQVARWVQDDMCSEFFNKALKYCLTEKQAHKKEKGFIDGSGLGYLERYKRDLKVNIEKTFDAKWYYKVERPLPYVYNNYDGLDLRRVANKIHPGHWSYTQGHSTKSLTAVQTCDSVFHLDKKCYRALLIVALVFGHGRDGNLIHFPMDTAASGYNTELKEFA